MSKIEIYFKQAKLWVHAKNNNIFLNLFFFYKKIIIFLVSPFGLARHNNNEIVQLLGPKFVGKKTPV